MNARASSLFIVFTVTLDAMGIGLIMPVMPDLIREIRGASIADAAYWGGLLTFAYASMQFLFGPLLGNLADRFGRRPVLVVSLLFMGLDYLLMAIAPTLLLLFLARIVSGITGATYAVAAAYLSDTSDKGKRSSSFGLIGAAFGIGFILGPALGGLLGEFGTRMPFFVAGGLALLNAGFGLLVLPETLSKEKRRRFEWRRANPLRALLRIKNLPGVGGLMLVVLIHSIAQNVYPSVWSYFTIEKLSWSVSTVGLSLAAYGLSAAIVQVSILRIMLARYGESSTAAAGMLISFLTFIGIVLIDSSLLIFAAMPVVALGAMVGPSLQGLMADRVTDGEQGELQGVFSSILALSSIISPLLMTNIFKEFTESGASIYFPGAPFIASAVLTIFALVFFLFFKKNGFKKTRLLKQSK